MIPIAARISAAVETKQGDFVPAPGHCFRQGKRPGVAGDDEGGGDIEKAGDENFRSGAGRASKGVGDQLGARSEQERSRRQEQEDCLDSAQFPLNQEQQSR